MIEKEMDLRGTKFLDMLPFWGPNASALPEGLRIKAHRLDGDSAYMGLTTPN